MSKSRGLAVASALVLAALASTAWSQQEEACSQPVTTGERPTIRDCIYIARASAGLVPCAECICDTNGSGDVRITDALHCLLFVVGAGVTLDCSACDSSTTTTLPECASCHDVLFGQEPEENLCEAAASYYDAFVACPCEQCGAECPRMCETTGEGAGMPCGSCLYERCRQTLVDCIEN